MTIKGINKFLTRYNVEFNRKSLLDFKGKTVSIEIATIIYKYLNTAAKQQIDRWPFHICKKGPSTDDINNTFRKKITYLFECISASGANIILVMEGKCPVAKDGTKHKRIQKVTQDLEKLKDCNIGSEEYKRLLINTYIPTDIHKDIVVELGKNMGFVVLQSEYEAEGVCGIIGSKYYSGAYKSHISICDDHDIIMYGPEYIGKNIKVINSIVYFETYQLEDILLNLKLLQNRNYNEKQYCEAFRRLQLLCLTSGNDYCDGVKGFGLNRIYSLMYKKEIFEFVDLCKENDIFVNIPYKKLYDTIINNCSFYEL